MTLRFEADGDFTTNNNVDIKATGTGSGLNVEIVANDDGLTTGGKAGGAVSIGGDIETLGGDFSSTGTSTFATGDADSIVTAGGNVTINHGGTVSFGDPVNAGAGAVALTAVVTLPRHPMRHYRCQPRCVQHLRCYHPGCQ